MRLEEGTRQGCEAENEWIRVRAPARPSDQWLFSLPGRRRSPRPRALGGSRHLEVRNAPNSRHELLAPSRPRGSVVLGASGRRPRRDPHDRRRPAREKEEREAGVGDGPERPVAARVPRARVGLSRHERAAPLVVPVVVAELRHEEQDRRPLEAVKVVVHVLRAARHARVRRDGEVLGEPRRAVAERLIDRLLERPVVARRALEVSLAERERGETGGRHGGGRLPLPVLEVLVPVVPVLIDRQQRVGETTRLHLGATRRAEDLVARVLLDGAGLVGLGVTVPARLAGLLALEGGGDLLDLLAHLLLDLPELLEGEVGAGDREGRDLGTVLLLGAEDVLDRLLVAVPRHRDADLLGGVEAEERVLGVREVGVAVPLAEARVAPGVRVAALDEEVHAPLGELEVARRRLPPLRRGRTLPVLLARRVGLDLAVLVARRLPAGARLESEEDAGGRVGVLDRAARDEVEGLRHLGVVGSDARLEERERGERRRPLLHVDRHAEGTAAVVPAPVARLLALEPGDPLVDRLVSAGGGRVVLGDDGSGHEHDQDRGDSTHVPSPAPARSTGQSRVECRDVTILLTPAQRPKDARRDRPRRWWREISLPPRRKDAKALSAGSLRLGVFAVKSLRAATFKVACRWRGLRGLCLGQ